MPKAPSNIKRYMIFCEPCTFKKILDTDSPDDLIGIPVAAIPSGAPRLDKTTGKVINRPEIPQLPKVKCPKCGRAIVVKPLPEVYSKAFTGIDEQKRRAQEEADKKQRIEDGTPPIRKGEEL